MKESTALKKRLSTSHTLEFPVSPTEMLWLNADAERCKNKTAFEQHIFFDELWLLLPFSRSIYTKQTICTPPSKPMR